MQPDPRQPTATPDRAGPPGPGRRDVLRAAGAAGVVLAAAGWTLARRSPPDTGTDREPSAAGSTAATGPWFNAFHAPIGAYATFTLGFPGASGGFGLESGAPANQSVFVGSDPPGDGGPWALPFFHDGVSGGVAPLARDAVHRDFGVATDTFTAQDLTFALCSPVRPVPDPADPAAARAPGDLSLPAGDGPLRALPDVLLPAVFAELTLDNRAGARPRRVFLGVTGESPRLMDAPLNGVVFGSQRTHTALVADSTEATAVTGSYMGAILDGQTGGGSIGALVATVPAGQRRTYRIALCFHRAGDVTTGVAMRYRYTDRYPRIEDVATAATTGLADRIEACRADDELVRSAGRTPEQTFLLAHAIRSYYGCTALLSDPDGRPWWNVMEGEYKYINTFDLTVDHLFYEVGMNPWTVRDGLDRAAGRYHYDSGTVSSRHRTSRPPVPAVSASPTTWATGPTTPSPGSRTTSTAARPASSPT
ncbi:hypothetical protein JS756_28885 [Streptomyces actuosus]|uniref:Uncharacterized protein n=1 Tax=Streptomyces actuosus TaxID=1885 RepID=A0ABS2VY26_STRAS|nr:glycoside hydrolase family 52 protein [Streptomyces actuosus]MBN0048057.1 hypothetical protein [Streptomyces actuosus]